jgi:hypothetical protein
LQPAVSSVTRHGDYYDYDDDDDDHTNDYYHKYDG